MAATDSPVADELPQETTLEASTASQNEAEVKDETSTLEAAATKAPEEAIISGVSGDSKESTSINKVLQETFLKMANMVGEGESFDEISKHIKSAEYLIQAAKALE